MFFAVVWGSLLLGGSCYAWWHYKEYRLTEVSPGALYRSAAMPPKVLRATIRRLGIRTMVDLRCPEEGEASIAAEAQVCEELGITHLNLESPQVPPDELRDRFLDWGEDPEHLPMLVHCNHGEGRAVLYGALWRIEVEGDDPEQARQNCRVLWTKGSSFDPRKPKGAYLRNYSKRT